MNEGREGCRLVVPDGSLKEVIHRLLADAHCAVSYPGGDRSYRGIIANKRLFAPPFDVVRRMRPWDSPKVVARGLAELAFTAQDLIAEAGVEDQVVVLDRYPLSRGGYGSTKLVLAVPENSPIQSVTDLMPEHEVATEYPSFARRWLDGKRVSPDIIHVHGSLEAFHGLADAIFENTETGLSLKVGGWRIVEQALESQTCLITYPAALENKVQANIIAEFRLLLNAVIAARTKVLVKCNVAARNCSDVCRILPSADEPTRSDLSKSGGFALEAVVEESAVERLIPELKAAGATAIVVVPISLFVR
ncbi:MAG: ATP phosphoribosyltransferase [Candidatus Buchananbacteria bacterium]|nr:ATP phosphoribosyltransferase [Candidatus Buchananbacteria bacterium]